MKILIVSPHFPPSNAADMHRVRLVLPYLQSCGIIATVLAVDPRSVASPRDTWLAEGMPPEIAIERVRGLGLAWSKIPGLGTLSYRAFLALLTTGNRLLQESMNSRPFDLVYFSTTAFGIHNLGPIWKKRFGVPYVIDYQDPWVSDYYRDHPDVIPPGGRLKYGVSQWLARRNEPTVIRQCAGITSVSDLYINQIRQRYHFANGLPALTIPFPADGRDIGRVRADATIRQAKFDPNDGKLHWVYVGRGGQDMHLALQALFAAFRRGLESDYELKNVRMHFLGTSYAAAGSGQPSIFPLAEKCGVSEFVEESTDRLPYSQTLRCLLDASALIVPGSNDRGYTASKIYPYLLTGKPILGIFHEQSSVHRIVQSIGGCKLVGFNDQTHIDQIAHEVYTNFFLENRYRHPVPLVRDHFSSHTAGHQAETLSIFFETLTRKSAGNS